MQTDAVVICATDDGLRIRLRVKAGGRRDRLIGAHGGALKLEVNAVPERGKANESVVELLAKTLDVSRTSVTIVSGTTSQDKVVGLRGCTVDEVVKRLREAGVDCVRG
jgi:uncharacterized protein (TIGR00251 family)